MDGAGAVPSGATGDPVTAVAGHCWQLQQAVHPSGMGCEGEGGGWGLGTTVTPGLVAQGCGEVPGTCGMFFSLLYTVSSLL